MLFRKKEKLRFRYENFGGLAWYPQSEIFKLSHSQIGLLNYLSNPKTIDEVKKHFSINDFELLLNGSFIEKSGADYKVDNTSSRIEHIREEIHKASQRKITRPFWVHIQPFTFCNQRCNHCYCSGGIAGSKFILSHEDWEKILESLKMLGVIEVYVTGGENFILNDSLKLIDLIIKEGFVTGVSTNAMRLSSEAIDFLKKWNLDWIQVSVDSLNPAIYDKIRGTNQALKRVLINIDTINQISGIIVNTVLNSWNIKEVESIIDYFTSRGISNFKFFPQKKSGKAQNLNNFLTQDEWLNIDFERIEALYPEASIDYIGKNDSNCGSGRVGFSISQNGDIYPCIFGIENANLRIGSALTDDLENLWFDESRWGIFRKKCNNLFCNRCE